MKLALIKFAEKPSISSRNEIIYKANDEFLDLVCYKSEDIIGRTLGELSILLKNDFQMCFSKIKEKTDLYIFGKQERPIDVSVTCKDIKEINERTYYIEKNENIVLENIIFNFGRLDINTKESLVVHSYPEGIHLKSNKTYVDSLIEAGYDMKEFIGSGSKSMRYKTDVINRGESFQELETEFTDIYGEKTYWDMNVRVILGPADKKYVMTSFYDVTERVLEKKYLEKQRIQMETILENISDSVVKLNKYGQYTYVNKAAQKKQSQYHEDVLYMKSKEFHKEFKLTDINGKEISVEDTPDQRAIKGEKFNNYIIIGTSKFPTTYHECSGVPIYDEYGEIDGGVVIYRDIEDRLKTEEYNAIKESNEDMFLSYVSLSYDDFKIKYINEKGFNKIKSVNSDIKSHLDLIGTNFFDYYMHKDEALKNESILEGIKKCIDDKTSYSHKQKLIIDGEVKYIKTIFKPIFDEFGEIKKINGIGMDITDEEIDAQKMRRTLEAQDEVFTNTSHELKTPLNLIFSASQLLNMYLKKDNLEEARLGFERNNKVITQNCYRLTKLINDILDISKIEEGFFELELDNRNIVKSIEDIVYSVSEYISDMRLEIIFNSEIKEKIIAFDLGKIERIMLNLISNAIKFSNANGIIEVALKDKGNFVEISVKDSGIGIKEEDLSLIFDKFKQVNKSLNRNVEGTGIGLSLVKSLAELHGGKMIVESTFGEGSTFTVDLPSMTAYEPKEDIVISNHDDRIEMIKFELSDIYI